MLSESYTSVSRLIHTEPSDLLRLRLSEPIASESASTCRRFDTWAFSFNTTSSIAIIQRGRINDNV